MSSKHLCGDTNYAWPTAEIAVMGAKVRPSSFPFSWLQDSTLPAQLGSVGKGVGPWGRQASGELGSGPWQSPFCTLTSGSDPGSRCLEWIRGFSRRERAESAELVVGGLDVSPTPSPAPKRARSHSCSPRRPSCSPDPADSGQGAFCCLVYSPHLSCFEIAVGVEPGISQAPTSPS